ncbi:hypothetical protein BDM02DRAFT_2054674 [Thelephora ganbajun]|uniref:Uncharacterized protein n=1 Tax=Thelephora ganbajun TaxID=370292 RepID=A0ACB6ZGV1_THEGA|nr:hypothetical protein BDM02DRAFT_2054674 [Thelephora ganbajun]
MESGDDELDVHFIQLPSVSGKVRFKQWLVRGLPKCDAVPKINPEVDLLVTSEVANEGRYANQPFDCSHGDDSRLSMVQIHILRLPDGFPHTLAPIDPNMHQVDCEPGGMLSSLDILVIRGHRFVVITVSEEASYFGRYDTLVAWDWCIGQRVLKTSCC